MMRKFCLLIGVLISMAAQAQEDVSTPTTIRGIDPENYTEEQGNGFFDNSDLAELYALADTFLYFPIAEVRAAANEVFIPKLVKLLRAPGSFYQPLDSLSRKVNIIYPADSSFRIFNWEVKVTDNIIRYFGAMQMAGPDLKLYPLYDYSAELTNGAMDSILTEGKWYGGIIYNIHRVTLPDGNTAYMTFAVNRNEQLSNKKIMDVVVIINGRPIQWGIPFINTPEGVKSRYIIEYNKMANVSLNYDPQRNLVYQDQTKSEINNESVKYTQIPVGDYSGFMWNGNSWNFINQLVQVTEYEEGMAPTGNAASPEVIYDTSNAKKKRKRTKKSPLD